MKKTIATSLLFFLLAAFCIPAVAQTQVIAHRGYWDCEGSAQNSIFALKKAQEITIYGSEFDVLVTSDGIPVVNHDDKIDGLLIESTPYEELKNKTLKNGETLPTLEPYLKQGKKDKKTKLILEIKPHTSKEKEDQAVKIITQMVKKMKLEKQTEYISFSLNICSEVLRYSKAKVAYLRGDKSPKELKDLGLTGLDYNHTVLKNNKDWILEAKQLGLTINVWTVNDSTLMQEFIDLDVDFITTDKPLDLKQLVSKKNQ